MSVRRLSGNKIDDSILPCPSKERYNLYFSWDEDSAFWISNNELIIRIVKEVATHAEFAKELSGNNSEADKYKPQYVKLKFKM